ncbi:MAG: exo-alpha-sialidase [Acidobacteriia bacterium]|nr:exo-alpha-sialidase [Terriglobia bacterium]
MTKSKQGDVLLLVGTRKGAFTFRSDARRKKWSIEEPLFPGRQVHHFIRDPRGDGKSRFAATFNDWFGSDIQRSTDGGRTWKASEGGVRYAEDAGLSVKCIWHIRPGRAGEPGVVYSGVDPAGLFRSEDGGATWAEVRGLTRHATRSQWTPGAGGLIAHTIILDPADPARMFVAISAAGVFRSDDGGTTWQPRNKNTRADFLPVKFPEIGQCVHKVVLAPGSSTRLYQQNHCGVYRTDSSGDSWKDISRGLPSRFGFVIAVHPRESETIWVIPAVGAEYRACPDGCLAVWRSTTGGRSWHKQTRGLPTRNAHLLVLREAISTDSSDPAGVYFGTETGQLFATREEGRNWELIADFLPPILSVEAATL